jgi:hypothetical protein
VRKSTPTKELGLRRKTSASSTTSNFMGKAVGVLFQKPQVILYLILYVYMT